MNHRAALMLQNMTPSSGVPKELLEEFDARLHRIERILQGLGNHPAIADAIATAEAEAKAEEERRAAEARAAQEAAQEQAKQQKIEQLRAQLASLEANGMPSPQQVAQSLGGAPGATEAASGG